MKKSICLALLIGVAFRVPAQAVLEISDVKTTSLIFPFPIRHIDRGGRNVLVEQVKEKENILLVKAAGNELTETNLTVVTEDGSVYGFTVHYVSAPANWIIYLPSPAKGSLEARASGLIDNPPVGKVIRCRKVGMEGEISGVYSNGDYLFMQLRLHNGSPIDYGLEYIRFRMEDKKRSRRTATQEQQLEPLFVKGRPDVVRPFESRVLVVALPAFLLPEGKRFFVEVGERSAARNLRLQLKNKHLLRARPVTK
jgi:hypothetical protein